MAVVKSSGRRQYVLLAALSIAVFVYFRFGGTGAGASSDSLGDLPPIDAQGLVKGLAAVSTVTGELELGPQGDSDPDRNLFQYGQRRPPPPPPMTEEQRRAEQARLEEIETQARAQKQREEEQAQAAAAVVEAARLAAEQQPPPPPPETVAQAPPVPVAPPRPQPPAITFRFVGVMGPAKKKVAVFAEGDKQVLARKGEVIDGKFKVLDIGPEWADMGYADPEFKNMRKRLYFGL